MSTCFIASHHVILNKYSQGKNAHACMRAHIISL